MRINPFHLGHSSADRKCLVNVELRLNGMVSKRGPSQNQAKDPQGTIDQSTALFGMRHIASVTILTLEPL